MPRRKKNDFTPGPITQKLIDDTAKALSERGAAGVNIGLLVDKIIADSNPVHLTSFLNEFTPLEHRLKAVLSDQVAMKDLERLLKRHEKPARTHTVAE